MSAAPETTQPNEPPRGGDNALRRLASLIARSWQALLWEQLWPPLAAALVVIGFFFAVSWAGLWISIPPIGRMIGLSLFGLLLLVSLSPFIWLRLPKQSEALARLDRSSEVAHRPATALTDSLTNATDDPVTEALWRAHRDSAAKAAQQLRASLPKPRLALRDPFAIRALALLAVVATFFMAGDDHTRRVAAAFDWKGAIASKLYRVDAWITPPAYTGRAPILLPGVRHDEPPARDQAAIAVPTGSELVVRATGLSSIDLAAKGGVAEQTDEKKPAAAESGIERHFKITADGSLSLAGLPAGDVLWSFHAIPDRAPKITLTRDPEASGSAGISLSYKIEDDYGVVSAEARFTRPTDTPPDPSAPPHPLVAPPNFPLLLPQARARSGTGQTTKDLTEHPWAGATVMLTLVARDEGGNVGLSEPIEIQLPERPFTKPLARALIEQRRSLAFDANEREEVATSLLALMIAPERFTPDAGTYLGLRTAFARLRLAKTDADLVAVVNYLWEVAVLIEDGDMSDVDRELRAAEDALRQALERGASDDEIRRLTQNLRDKLDKFMQALTEQLRKQDGANERPLDRNARVVRPQDLKNMLDRIENLARNGARDSARKMLDEMQAMLDSLSRNRQARRGPNQDNGNSQLDQLGRMIQEQQRLRDKTYRQGRENQRGERNGQPGDRQRRALGDLRGNQQGLREQLEQMLKQLQRQGQGQEQGQEQGEGENEGKGPGKEAGDALGRAGKAMQDAEGALNDGETDNAVDAQGRALRNLRKGAQSLADAMQGEGEEGTGEAMGNSANSSDRTDPLGRPRRSRDYGDDFSVKIPGEIDVQRARRVLEELRRRYSDPNRPRIELDYLQRLLRDFDF